MDRDAGEGAYAELFQSCFQAFPPSNLGDHVAPRICTTCFNPVFRLFPLPTRDLATWERIWDTFQSCFQAFPPSNIIIDELADLMIVGFNPVFRLFPLPTLQFEHFVLPLVCFNPVFRLFPLPTSQIHAALFSFADSFNPVFRLFPLPTPAPLAALERPNEKALCERPLLGAEKWAHFSAISPSLSPAPASQA